MTSIQNDAVRSIVKQWNGGEHVLAGARASELVYGKSKTADEGLLKQLTEGAVGIERYITAPSSEPIEMVDDQGGNPMATQPENREEATGASNGSTDQAKEEQNRIDDALAPGREAHGGSAWGNVGSTELNPEGSDKASAGKNSNPDAVKDEPKPTDNPTDLSKDASAKTQATKKTSSRKATKPAA